MLNLGEFQRVLAKLGLDGALAQGRPMFNAMFNAFDQAGTPVYPPLRILA